MREEEEKQPLERLEREGKRIAKRTTRRLKKTKKQKRRKKEEEDDDDDDMMKKERKEDDRKEQVFADSTWAQNVFLGSCFFH